jgi:ESF2/ABP1 family protein
MRLRTREGHDQAAELEDAPLARKRRRAVTSPGAPAAEEAPPQTKKRQRECSTAPQATLAESTASLKEASIAPSNVLRDAAELGDKKGVVHFASLPAFMKPEKLRHMMEQFGEIGRVYLAPEDKSERQRRKRTGGNRKLKYGEGWVEFENRKIAKRVALTLNGTPVGGKKRRNHYRDDLWNIRYLPRFGWYQLKEGIIYNQHVRKARLDQKVGQARRENDFFLEKVEQAKFQKRSANRVSVKTGVAKAVPRVEGESSAVRGRNSVAPSASSVSGAVISDRVLSRLL